MPSCPLESECNIWEGEEDSGECHEIPVQGQLPRVWTGNTCREGFADGCGLLETSLRRAWYQQNDRYQT